MRLPLLAGNFVSGAQTLPILDPIPKDVWPAAGPRGRARMPRPRAPASRRGAAGPSARASHPAEWPSVLKRERSATPKRPAQFPQRARQYYYRPQGRGQI